MRTWLTAGTVGLSAAALAAGAASAATPPGATIRVLSNRADLISSGDALVAVDPPRGVRASSIRLSLGRRDVTNVFGIRPSGRFEGVVSGLALGPNALSARISGRPATQITITNHPNGGPVFSGPQVQPWGCQKTAVDKQCNQPARFSYLYRSTDATKAGLQTYDPSNPPSDIATTTTDQGVSVPFIVRQETGYQDRDQYKILTLFAPGKPWSRWHPQKQWNHKLMITHGGGCGVDYETGSAPLADYSGTLPAPVPGYIDSYIVGLGRGFAVMSTALDNNGHNCNILTQAESLMMGKEHVIEAYGDLRYTIGSGCSGGSLTQQWVSNAYPGIYQGILPQCSFPDTWTSATQVGEYHLLRAYFEDPSKWGAGVAWTPTQIAAVEGHALPVDAIVSDIGFFNAAISTHPCGGITDQQRYDPQTHPGGVRCGIADYTINVFGRRPHSVWSPQEHQVGHGFAGLALDNVGVQYGLEPLQQGQITPAQFADLNAKIGGLDIDARPTAHRLVADEPALRNAYRSGAINETNHLKDVAIIDLRGPDPGAAHDSYRTFAVRARLAQQNGTFANQVVWEGPFLIIGDPQYTAQGLVAMDRWLAVVESDHRDMPVAVKVIQDKPPDIHDQCSDGNGMKVSDQLCPPAVVPVYATPRMAAGESITTDTNKCQLKSLDRGDHGPLPFTDAEWAQLSATFATGVCDFGKPPVDKSNAIPWLTYQDATGRVIYGGRPLGGAPRSSVIQPKRKRRSRTRRGRR
jgi:uncharacterized tannase-like protein DUF6351